MALQLIIGYTDGAQFIGEVDAFDDGALKRSEHGYVEVHYPFLYLEVRDRSGDTNVALKAFSAQFAVSRWRATIRSYYQVPLEARALREAYESAALKEHARQAGLTVA